MDWKFWRRWTAPPSPPVSPERPPVIMLLDNQGQPMTLAHAQEVLKRPKAGGAEIGSSGTPRAGDTLGVDEYNRDLAGKNAIRAYDRMRRSDGQVRAVLDLLKLPLLGASWEIIPPENGDATDQQIAEFCHAVLIDDDGMTESWDYVLRHILLMLDFGFSVFEKVWDVGLENRLVYHRLAPRLPMSIDKWLVDDATGRLVTVVQRAVKDGQEKEIEIPAEDCAVFVHNREGDNYNGISVLRPLYKHHHFKDRLYTIDAIGHERLSVGIPMAEFDEVADRSSASLEAVAQVLEGIRAHERAHLMAMPGIRFKLLQTENSNAGLMASIEHHDVMIARGILAPFMNVGQAAHGTRSSTIELVDVYFNGLEGIARAISGTAKTELIRPLCDFNFPMEGRKYPTLVARNIRKIDPQVLATTLTTAVGASVLTVDDGIENAFRQVMGYPPLAPEMARANRPEPTTRPQGQGGAEVDSDVEERPEIAASVARANGRTYGWLRQREPNDFEARVLSLNQIPKRLDREVATLIDELSQIRTMQVREAARALVAIDARSNPKRPFSELDPKRFALKYRTDVERAIRRAQWIIAEFGAEQVRVELRRQGMPIELGLEDGEAQIMLDVVVSGVVQPGSVRDQLAASARATAEQLNSQLRTVLMTEAVRLRRTGLTGEELENAIAQAAAANRNLAQPVNGRINEAFAMGRAAEAYRHRDEIAYVVQSALLDNATCPNCAGADGLTFAFGSREQMGYQPPYIDCRGRENCRCVQLYVYAGGGG